MMISRSQNIVYLVKNISIIFLGLGLMGSNATAQGTLPPLEVSGSFKKANLKEELLVLDTPDLLTPVDALKALKNPTISRSIQSTSFGFSKNFYWLYFTIENVSRTPQNLMVVVNNPHINQLRLYEGLGSKTQLIAQGGDGMVFTDRTYIDRRFVAPITINSNTKKEFALMVDKRFASVSVPISVQNQQVFKVSASNNLLVLGVYFGAILIIVVYSLVVYLNIKQEIFFWYAFYIFFLGLYLLAHLGLLFQYVHPNSFGFSDYARPVFVTWLATGLVRFIQLLLKTKEFLPRMERWYKYILIALNLATLWWWFTPAFHDAQTIWFLKLQNLLVIILLFMVLISSILTFNKQRAMVAFFFVAFLAVLIGGLSVILIEIGAVSEDLFPMNPLLVGSMVEIVVFAMGLSYWLNKMNEERIHLAKEMQGVKNKLEESFVLGIETEKQKIASELHDDIGSRLSHLKRTLDSKNADAILLDKIGELNKTVRRLSHELAPPRFEQDEFLISVQHLIKSHETEKLKIGFQVFDVPAVLEVEITKQLYRIIQSALSNIELHSKATHVDIQLFYHNNELVLSIEDNGVGFILQNSYSGNGIKSMRSRAETIGGTIEISSSLQYGTSIMVTVSVH